MKKIIEINNEALTAITGGCHCYCFRVPFHRPDPTTYIGAKLNESECSSACVSSNLRYARCPDVAPTTISFTREEMLKIGNLAKIMNTAFRSRYAGNM